MQPLPGKQSADARFCNACGSRGLDAAAPAGAPRDYTPRHLAERILTSRAGIEGERKQVTVLFADVKGSMELLADRDPEEARELLDAVLERMMAAVHRYEGTVNQVMGDGIMALFGAPLAARTTPCAPASPRCASRRKSGATQRSSGVRAVCPFTCASASIRARSSCARSATIYAWTTRRSGKRRIWLHEWSRWRSPDAP